MLHFSIKRFDQSPALQAQLLGENNSPIDLTGASVRFVMATSLGQTPIVDAAATIVDPTNGVVKYQWAAGDTDALGRYIAEFKVTFPDGIKRTFPAQGYIYVEIAQNIG